MKTYLYTSLFLVLIFFGCNTNRTKEDNLDVQQFVEKMVATEEYNLVDVRTPEEFERGHLENAQNINLNSENFENKIEELDKDIPVFLYCLTDNRSKTAAKDLRKKGFKVYLLNGGILQWRAENLPEVGKQETIASGMTLEDFNALLKTDKTVLIDFYADWCGPCKLMEPYLNEISKDMNKDVKLIRIDADKNSGLAQQLGISALPFLQIYKNDKMVWENIGFIEKDDVVKQLNKYL